jgi:hypothetical protein
MLAAKSGRDAGFMGVEGIEVHSWASNPRSVITFGSASFVSLAGIFRFGHGPCRAHGMRLLFS